MLHHNFIPDFQTVGYILSLTYIKIMKKERFFKYVYPASLKSMAS